MFLIEPYHYFQCTAELNNAAGNGIGGGSGTDADADGDTHLVHATTVLKVHCPSFLLLTDQRTG